MRAPWTATVVTLFPEMFPGPLGHSLAGRALADGLWRLDAIDIRDHATDRHRTVDDTPCGGGPGMVLRPDVVDAALAAAGDGGRAMIYLSPRGRLLDQARVRDLAAGPGVTLLCGRFEGVDQRVIDAHALEEISLGDYVLSGGEPAALALIDACVRLLPGVVGSADTLIEEPAARRQEESRPGASRRHREIDHVGTHHHAGAAAERRIIDGAVFIAREVPDVHRFQAPDAVRQRLARERAAEWPRKHLREDREHRGDPGSHVIPLRPRPLPLPHPPRPAGCRAALPAHRSPACLPPAPPPEPPGC